MSDYYCAKVGTDTCVISPSNINFQDTFYFGVRCIDACNYNIRVQYLSVNLLSDGTQYNFNAESHSSVLFSYYIPSSASNGFTSAIRLLMYGTNTYDSINIFLSTNNDIYQVEEKRNQVVYSKGVALKFTSNDNNFCTQCYIYTLIDIQKEDSYYVTIKSSARNEIITSGQSNDIVINARQYECFQYSIQKTSTDVLIYANRYEGIEDVYISQGSYPQKMTDKSVVFISQSYQKRTILLRGADRQVWGSLQGIYYVCANSYEDTSMGITIYETSSSSSYTLSDNNQFNARLYNNSQISFSYTHSELSKPSIIQVTLTVTPYLNPNTPPKIFYKICKNSGSCSFTADEAQGKQNQTVKEIGVVIQSNNTKVAFLNHNPSVCANPSKCYYLFSVAINSSSTPIQFALIANHTEFAPQSVYISQAYVNVLEIGAYQYYQILPSNNSNMIFLSGIKINLISYQGDADLYVSTTNQFPSISNYNYMSNRIGMYDQVIINTTNSIPVLAIPIYIAVYSYKRASFYINFTPYYIDQYNSQLQGATVVQESKGFYTYLKNQYDSGFYSFTPWWTGSEQRDIILFSQQVFNNIQIYASADSLPVSTQSQYIGQNNTIYIQANSNINAKLSTYFVKLVPNFALYDVISNRQFISYFFAFSQKTRNSMTDVQLNQQFMGFANNSHNYYRHFIEAPYETYVITLNVAYGLPTLLMGLTGGLPLYPTVGNYTSYMFTQNVKIVNGKSIVQQKLSFSDRTFVEPSCQTGYPGYYLNGGNPACTFYIGVYCPYACVYNLTIAIENFNPNYTIYPAYLLENQYATGMLAPNESIYYYFPLTNNTGEVTFFLNKTKLTGFQNGDLSLSMVVLNDTATQFISYSVNNWFWYFFSGYSSSGLANQPELIEICGNTFNKFCIGNQSCAVLMGIHSRSYTLPSFYRLKGITDTKKLANMMPILKSLLNVNDYHYYYFTNNLTVSNPQIFWEFTVSLEIMNAGGDADLFVSAIDGRNPSNLDYDFASQRNGADSIYISSNTNFFSQSNYNVQNGILFIVGVRAMTQNVQYSLMLQGPTRYNYSIYDINLTNSQTYTFTQFNNKTKKPQGPQSITYRWFNLGSDNFQISISCQAGIVYGFLNFYSQESYLSNIYESIPINENNSLWSTAVNTSQTSTLRVYKSGTPPGLFCYFCWYYITVNTNYTAIDSTFQLAVQRIADSGAAITQILPNVQQTSTIKSAQSISQSKFMMDNKNPFSISLTVTAGSVQMYVGLYPDAPTTQAAWTVSSSVGSTVLNVRQTDPNFHLGAWYFITFVSQTANTQVIYQVNQYKSVTILQSGITIKDQYITEEEQVKFYVIQAPLGSYKVTINLQGIDDNFYPLIYQNKANLTAVPSDFRVMNFSNLTFFNQKFGDNITAVMNSNSFVYNYSDTAVTNFTYQLFTVYANQFGLTDRRKQSFFISATITSNSLKESFPNQKFESMNAEELIVEREDKIDKDSADIKENDFEIIHYDIEEEIQKMKKQYEKEVWEEKKKEYRENLAVKNVFQQVKEKFESISKQQKNTDY